jgi:hypothetical protein
LREATAEMTFPFGEESAEFPEESEDIAKESSGVSVESAGVVVESFTIVGGFFMPTLILRGIFLGSSMFCSRCGFMPLFVLGLDRRCKALFAAPISAMFSPSGEVGARYFGAFSWSKCRGQRAWVLGGQRGGLE